MYGGGGSTPGISIPSSSSIASIALAGRDWDRGGGGRGGFLRLGSASAAKMSSSPSVGFRREGGYM